MNMTQMISMLVNDRRVYIAKDTSVDRSAICRKEESLRLAQFRYSRTVMAGDRANFRLIQDTPTHQERQ